MLTPDSTFVRELKEISPDLSVVWTPVLNRWVIWYQSSDGTKHRIHEVKNPDGSFRPLDNRTLTMLKRCDMSRVKDPRYEQSKQFQRMKEAKAAYRRQQHDNAQERKKEISEKKWGAALDNARRGIFNEHQLDRKIISMPNIFGSTRALLKKFGKPHLTGEITYI